MMLWSRAWAGSDRGTRRAASDPEAIASSHPSGPMAPSHSADATTPIDSGHTVAPAGLGDRIAQAVAARTSQLVLGLDPDPAHLWPRALELAGPSTGAPAERAARAVKAHCALVLEAVAEQCVAVKPQVACFERLGAPGWAALQEVVDRAHEHGLLVIADGKRGDIDVTAVAYAQAFVGETPTPFGTVPGLGADAVTANPLLGSDALEPLVLGARQRRRGVFVLVRTSNPGAAELQERAVSEGGTVSELLAEMVARLGAPGIGSAGLADVGAVVGATAPHRLQQLRERMPHTVFLLPGVGAQGGRVQDLTAAFAPGPAGGLVSASRGIVAAHERTPTDPATATTDPATAAVTEARRLRELAWQLST
jgi:orotidine-5'-phosphate decarboxylase